MSVGIGSKRTRDSLEADVEVRDLGEHRLKDLPEPEWLFQVLAPDLEPSFPPLRSLSNTNLPAEISKFRDDEEKRLLPIMQAAGIKPT